MAYIRWSGSSDWYIYYLATSSTKRNEQTLVVNRAGHDAQELPFPLVNKILHTGDFSYIREIRSDYDREILRVCLKAFKADVLECYPQ